MYPYSLTKTDRKFVLTGPWDDEPDRIVWQDKTTGYWCCINRNVSGALCGYVAIDNKHSCYGKTYSDVPVQVHWGLTFEGLNEKTNFEATNKPTDLQWFGFDCSHCEDLCPAYDREFRHSGVYRDVDFVRDQCTNLAKQLQSLSNHQW